jgi:hypothetical protein
MMTIFKAIQIWLGIKDKASRPGNQPPQKRTTLIADMSNILLYSPKKNIAKMMEEYSTLYPATSSASASGKSNGARLVSANIDTKKIIAQGNKGAANQIVRSCAKTISVILDEPASRITGRIVSPIETS